MEFDYAKHVFRAPELQSIVDRAVEFFSNTVVYEFPPSFRMNGAGVYGLYYLGGYEPYAPNDIEHDLIGTVELKYEAA